MKVKLGDKITLKARQIIEKGTTLTVGEDVSIEEVNVINNLSKDCTLFEPSELIDRFLSSDNTIIGPTKYATVNWNKNE